MHLSKNVNALEDVGPSGQFKIKHNENKNLRSKSEEVSTDPSLKCQQFHLNLVSN